jgi:3-deoxy-manno-octulosonate cytidylyltransferase (CMP-KDO synthetase)
MLKTAAVIPARFGSSRFLGKPLALIAGKPMIQWTCERAAASKADHILVATDDLRIKECVEKCGFTAVMTSESHQSGTDRIAEAVAGMDLDLIINLQGDEPMLPSAVIDQLIDTMNANLNLEMATVAVPASIDSESYRDPNSVKLVTDLHGKALYFSRSPLPFFRNQPPQASCLLHWGIYAYRRHFLDKFITWPQSQLELAESLEQLRAMENGASIQVITVNEKALGVDTPEDIIKVENYLRDIRK